jgi:phage terminase large subunit-like protein
MLGIDFFNKFLSDVQVRPNDFCQWVKLAVKRHIMDLKESKKYHFDEKEADRAIKFVQLLKHTKGEWANKPFNLQPFQAFIIGSVFGWRDENDKRRFRKAYCKIARKNGKTELAGAIGLYGYFMDNEAGAEIYCAATKKQQAKICFDVIKKMHDRLKNDSKSIAKLVKESNKHSIIKADGSVIKYLGKDSDTEDGLNPHMGIIDEYHAHPDSDMLKVLETGMGARRQPLIFIITTAGTNKKSVCNDFERSVCQQVLKGQKKNERLFCIMFDLDDYETEWHDKNKWIKANPNIGDAPYWDYMLGQYNNAITEGASSLRQFQTKNLNVWTTNEASWFSAGVWEGCQSPFDINLLKREVCYGGLDLASVRDLTSYKLFFPPNKYSDKPIVLSWFFVPRDMAEERSRKDSVKYIDWIEEGYIIGTPGNVTDYDFLQKIVIETNQEYDVKSVGYDRYNSSQLVINLLQEGINMQPFGQGYVSMSPACKALEKMILGGDINHLGNPVLAWNIDNVVTDEDAAGNIKINKAKSTEKVDGAVALAMAIGQFLDDCKNPKVAPAYAQRGLRYL